MRALRISSGILVWALHFTAIYGYTALACARGFGASAPWVVAAATLAALAAAAIVFARFRGDEFYGWLTAGVAAFAAVAIVWEGLSAFLVPACD